MRIADVLLPVRESMDHDLAARPDTFSDSNFDLFRGRIANMQRKMESAIRITAGYDISSLGYKTISLPDFRSEAALAECHPKLAK